LVEFSFIVTRRYGIRHSSVRATTRRADGTYSFNRLHTLNARFIQSVHGLDRPRRSDDRCDVLVTLAASWQHDNIAPSYNVVSL
jgi:hypothetical protein